MIVVKLQKFSELTATANIVYQDQIQRVREEKKTTERNAKEIRVQKQPNLSYTREGVLKAVVAGKEYFKPQITQKWKGTRRAKCWVQFYYPEERLKEVASEQLR